MSRYIKLSNKYVAIVDDADYNRVVNFGCWFRQKRKSYSKLNYYAFSNNGKKNKPLYMHQFIFGFPYSKTGKIIHHINGKGWDNRRENLKIISRSEHTKLHCKIKGKG